MQEVTEKSRIEQENQSHGRVRARERGTICLTGVKGVDGGYDSKKLNKRIGEPEGPQEGTIG